MSKRSHVTNITALPESVSRETAVSLLHNHVEMIELNPLVMRHNTTSAPPHAPSDEMDDMTWYELTDMIQYIPGTPAKGEITYKAGFYDRPRGLQTHVFAPMGVEIRGKWHVGGSLPGEEKEPAELGFTGPKEGLYLREDVDLRCNFLLAGFVKGNLKKSHGVLVDKLIQKAQAAGDGGSHSSTPLNAVDQNTSGAGPTHRADDEARTNSRHSSAPGAQTYASNNSPRISAPATCSCTGALHSPSCKGCPELPPGSRAEHAHAQHADPRSAPAPSTKQSSGTSTVSGGYQPYSPPYRPEGPQRIGEQAELHSTPAPMWQGIRPVELEGNSSWARPDSESRRRSEARP